MRQKYPTLPNMKYMALSLIQTLYLNIQNHVVSCELSFPNYLFNLSTPPPISIVDLDL